MPKDRPKDADQELAARRALARALAAAEPEPLAAWLDVHTLRQEDLAWLEQQGLALLGLYRVQQANLLDRVSPDVTARWEALYREVKIEIDFMNWEIERILVSLGQAGVDFVLLKGAALAHTVYPKPVCRGLADLDLWTPVEQLALATAVLQSHGFRLHSKADRPEALVMLIGGELQMMNGDSLVGLIELQWPALRGEWVRHTAAIDHAAIWQRRSSVAIGEHRFATMTPEDMLIHLCLHQAINHQFSGPWLRGLLDVHLLAVTQPVEWSQVVVRAVDWRLATVVWTELYLAQRLLSTPVPASVMQSLAPARWRRWLIDRLNLDETLLSMRPMRYDHRRFLIQMALVDRLRDGFRLLWRGLFPEAAWLRARYAATPGQRLWRLRLLHVWSLATSARA